MPAQVGMGLTDLSNIWGPQFWHDVCNMKCKKKGRAIFLAAVLGFVYVINAFLFIYLYGYQEQMSIFSQKSCYL